MTTEQHGKRIGELNGPWSVLARINWVLLPPFFVAVIGLGSWMVSTLNSHATTLAVLNEWKSQRVVALDSLVGRVNILESEQRRMQLEWVQGRTQLEGTVREIDRKLDQILDVITSHMRGEEDAKKKLGTIR